MIVNVFKPVYMAGNNLLESAFSRFDNYTFFRVDVAIRSILAFCVGIVTFLAVGFFGLEVRTNLLQHGVPGWNGTELSEQICFF